MEENVSQELPEEQPVASTTAEPVANGAMEPEQASTETEAVETKAQATEKQEPQVNTLTAEEIKEKSDDDLLDYLRSLMQSPSARKVMRAVRDVKTEVSARVADSKRRAEAIFEKQREEGDDTKFEYQPSQSEGLFEQLFKRFDEVLNAEHEELRKLQEANAALKSKVIIELTSLVEKVGDVNPSSKLKKVKELIAKWKEIGQIPNDKRDMNNTFRNLTDKYFASLNDEREMREYDERKNLEEKTKLCEEAEALKDAKSAQQAYFTLQRLFANWKAIGSVPSAESESIWERFNAARQFIQKRFHKQNEDDKQKELVNLEEKTKLCEEAEAVASVSLETTKEVDDAANKILDLQKRWRTFGYAPKEVNDQIYARFRTVCDKVFNAKREVYKQQNAVFAENLKLKEELCEKAEAIMNSTEWRKTANTLIDLQKQWKQIGPVSHRHSEAIWKRFRSACDTFFESRQQQQQGNEAEMADNLAKKKELIDELKTISDIVDEKEHMDRLQDVMHKWNAIGHVPMADKNKINKDYSDLINKNFDALNIDKEGSEVERYKSRMEAFASDHDKISKERNYLTQQLRQAQQDIETLENNIGFFSKSSKSDAIVASVQSKIEAARRKKELIAKKIEVLDNLSD